MQMIHVRFEGRSWDVPQAALDIGGLSSDDQVKAALARHLGVPQRSLAPYVVERHDGNITVRPEAVFG